MALDTEASADGFIRKVQRALGKGSQGAQLDALLHGHEGLNGLEKLPTAWLADKPRARHKIRVRGRPTAGERGVEESVIEILNDDMPFLVDSVLGELQARGLDVRLLFHPIFKTERDKAGRLLAITGPGDQNWSDGHQESYIAIHLRALREAEARELEQTISAILAEVRVVVADWRPMRQRLDAAIRQLEATSAAIALDLLAESTAFLHWLEQDNFTFLGAREFELVAMTPEVRRFFLEPSPLIITKANVTSRVHRRAHMDYIGVKTYHRDGTPKGEMRFIGLFTSQAHVSPPGEIPLLRHKVETVLAASGYPPASHA